MKIAYYISGHGYGHAIRSLRIARALAHAHRICIVSPLDRKFFEKNFPHPFDYRRTRLDVGVVQPDSLRLDLPATLERLDGWATHAQTLIRQEAAWMIQQGIGRALADIPAIPCAAGREAGVPVGAMTNFSWDDIYRPYEAQHPGFAKMADRFSELYAQADVLFRLPFSTEMAAFDRSVDFGMVGRRARLDRDAVRARLGMGDGRWALLSYGGMGLGEMAPERWEIPSGWTLMNVGGVSGDWRIQRGVHIVSEAQLREHQIDYPDIVGAVDAVLTKPGYGIVSECMANRTPIVYSDRGDFAEYVKLVDGIERWMTGVHLDQSNLRKGKIGKALERIREMPWPSETLSALDDQAIREGLEPLLREES